MNVTFTHIVINYDEEVFVGSYAMDADAARDVFKPYFKRFKMRFKRYFRIQRR